ncbi:unnamed protein product [Phaedon cochleariae]|uniref:Uncharacterized protein n=1 Tax=Phaedon cochleariae TaxID=80249 RepID=A0A9N9SQ80_PHACE|nr:unnamed protein product [Phaedon cochleariae]
MEIPASLLVTTGTFVYVAVKGSLHSSDTSVFGLCEVEVKALVKRFSNKQKEVINGIILEAPPIVVINALSQLGYRVVATTGASQSLDEMEFERGIWYAAQYGDLDRVIKLLNKCNDPDMRDTAGYTALHYAARNGHMQVCQLLVNKGADVNGVTRGGATALGRAALAGEGQIVDFLLTMKADPFIQDSDGKTALHRAKENGHLEICRKLLRFAPTLKEVSDNKGNKVDDLI